MSSATHDNIDTIDRSEFLNRFFVCHQAWLASWLRKKTGCPRHAADLVQETFMRVLALADPAQLQQPRAFLTTAATCGAFLMNSLGGAGHAEIAAELGVSVSMVKQYIGTTTWGQRTVFLYSSLIATETPDYKGRGRTFGLTYSLDY